jgi:hypothetical protein
MPRRRVLLRLPEHPTEGALALARAIQATLGGAYQVRLDAGPESFDDVTPVEGLTRQPLVLTIEDPTAPDGAGGTNHGN